jgi:chemotaxis protein histidine kinase CheA
MNSLLRALRSLGGSRFVEEIYDNVVELEKLLDDVLSQFHDSEKSNQTEVAHRLTWARTYLKKYGVLENSTRGVWTLTAKAKETEQVDPQDVVKTVWALDKKEATGADPGTAAPAEVSEEEEWKQRLHAILTQKLPPAAFERFVQRLLLLCVCRRWRGPCQHRGPGGFPLAQVRRGWLLPHCTRALNNIAKHARARNVSITVTTQPGTLDLVVGDDGIGFDPEAVLGGGDPKRSRMITMRERAQAIGGTLTIDSAPGKGTRIIVAIVT